MNYQQFKKRILVETGIFAITVVALAAVTFLLSTISDDYEENNNTAKKRVDGIDAELNALQRKYTFISQNADLYQEVQKKQLQGQLAINRQLVLEKFNQFRTQFNLANLRLSASPPQDMKDAKYKRATSAVTYSEVNVGFEVLSDRSIYELINAMQHELAGVCVMSRLTMSLQKPIGPEVLRSISAKGTYPLIKSDIHFIWYSINPVETNDSAPKK